jgi:DNA-binding CsgD family transcriptional regulator
MAATSLDFEAVSGIDITASYGVDEFLRAALAHSARPLEPEFSLDLAAIWRDLAQGKWFALSGFCSRTDCFLVLARQRAGVPDRPAPPQAWSMLERVLTGESQKALAIEASLANSTVATRCATGLRSIGSEHALSCAPTLLLLAAHAARGTKLCSARARRMAAGSEERWLVRCGRPDGALQGPLSAAERAVVGLLVEGRTHAQMALIRQRSERTIANQLGSAFRKLGVSGRTALVRKLLELEQQRSPADANTEQRLH